MSLRFSLADRQLRLFRFALQSLQKIGGELLLEALPARLVLRSINTSRSAYMSVTLDANFFDAYDVFDCAIVQAGLVMKLVLSVFRTQRVSKITFELNPAHARLTVTLTCENGLRKSYRLPTTCAEILEASVDLEAYSVRLAAETGAVGRLLSSFSPGLEEVTLVAAPEGAPQGVALASFLDPLGGGADKSLYTSVAVDPREAFLAYSNTSDEVRDVTFNLKDFKAMLSLCENLGSQVEMRLEAPGAPMVVKPSFPTLQGQAVDYDAELILATLTESHADSVAGQPQRAAPATGTGAEQPRSAMQHPGSHNWENSGGYANVDTPLAGAAAAANGGGTPRGLELGLTSAPGRSGRAFDSRVARPPSGSGAGQSRFSHEAGAGRVQQQPQLSGLDDDPSMLQQHQRGGGDHNEAGVVSWEQLPDHHTGEQDEAEAIPSSPGQPPAPPNGGYRFPGTL